MKARKFVSILCAAAMVASSLTAFAAEPNDANRISERAGKTATCQVVTATDEGVTSVVYEVPIPAGTTKAAEEIIVRNYALQTGETASAYSLQRAKVPQPGEWSGPYICVSYIAQRFNLNTTARVTVGGGTLQEVDNYSTYPVLLVEFDQMVPGNGATSMNVLVENTTNGKSWLQSFELEKLADYTFFRQRNTKSFELESGETITVKAYPNAGYASATSCGVYVSPFSNQ